MQRPFHKLTSMRTRIKRLRLRRSGTDAEGIRAISEAFPFSGVAKLSGEVCVVSKPVDSFGRDTESNATTVGERVRLRDFVRCSVGDEFRPRRWMSVSSWDRGSRSVNGDAKGADSVVGVVGWLASASYCLVMYPRVFIV